jgi:heme O synthase-like polyprenyltransferase
MGALVGAMIPFLLIYLSKDNKVRSLAWDIAAIFFVWLISFMVSFICGCFDRYELFDVAG